VSARRLLRFGCCGLGSLALLLGGPLVGHAQPVGAPAPPAASAPAPPAASAPASGAPASAPATPAVAAAPFAATAEVKIVQAPDDRPLPGAIVELQVVPSDKAQPGRRVQATSDEAGTARFADLSLQAGEELVARTEHQGQTVSSAPAPAAPQILLTLRLPLVQRDPLLLRLVRVSTEIGVWEGSVQVTQHLVVENPTDAVVDLRDPTGERPGLVFPLPAGFRDGTATGLGFILVDQTARLRERVAPGEAGRVSLKLRYALPLQSSTLRFVQPLPVPAREIMTFIPRFPAPLGRPLDGVELRVVDHNHVGQREQTTDQGTFHLLHGAPAEEAREVRFTVTGLPARSYWPQILATLLALLLLGSGAWWRARRGQVAQDLPPTGGGREREELFRRLEKLARERRQRGEEGFSPEQERLIQRLAELHGEQEPR